MYIESSEFRQFLLGGLATLSFIFSVISYSILKISVPIWYTPTFAFWISLKVVMAVFPQNDIFLRHLVYNNNLLGKSYDLGHEIDLLNMCMQCRVQSV